MPDGKLADFRCAVKATPDDKIVFTFMEWPSREVCDAATKQMMSDDNVKPPEGTDMPFDMVYGGGRQIVTLDGYPPIPSRAQVRSG